MSKRPRILLVNVCAAFVHHASCSEGRRLVNFVKLLTVPALLLLSGVMAVPAFGAEATISNLTAACNSDPRVCFSFDVATLDFTAFGDSRVRSSLPWTVARCDRPLGEPLPDLHRKERNGGRA